MFGMSGYLSAIVQSVVIEIEKNNSAKLKNESTEDYLKKDNVGKIFAVVVSLFVLVCLVLSISITGTPNEVRKMKLDDERLTNISLIQQEVFNYFSVKYSFTFFINS